DARIPSRADEQKRRGGRIRIAKHDSAATSRGRGRIASICRERCLKLFASVRPANEEKTVAVGANAFGRRGQSKSSGACGVISVMIRHAANGFLNPITGPSGF